MKKIGRTELSRLLTNNVCEIVFVRRRPERARGRPETRKMICSNSMDLLNSHRGITALNFHLPRGPKMVDERVHNLVVVWDIFMQDYRNVSMESCYLMRKTPANDEFWKYYDEVLVHMEASDKMQFMDS